MSADLASSFGDKNAQVKDQGLLQLYTTLPERYNGHRLVLDLRADEAFHQAHLIGSYHITPISALKSRYSYLPPRTDAFLVVADHSQCQEVLDAFSSTPSAQLVFLSESSPIVAAEAKVRVIQTGTFFEALKVYIASSQCHRQRATIRSKCSDAPQLLFRPSRAVERTVVHIEGQHDSSKPSLRVLDLGCGAARDLAWILHGSRIRSTATIEDGSLQLRSWTGVGIDNWKAVLNRAQQLMEDLYLHSPQQDLNDAATRPTSCEKLLWAKCSDDGFLEPLVGTGKGKAIQPRGASTLTSGDAQIWDEYVDLGLAPLLPTPTLEAPAPSPSGQEETQFDLILSIRFHPRALLPRLSHVVRPGGVILLSHFVTLSESERTQALQQSPWAKCDYDSPPHEGRVQPGEVESLLRTWNSSDEPGFEWSILENRLEPIEDGRVIRSVAFQKRRVS